MMTQIDLSRGKDKKSLCSGVTEQLYCATCFVFLYFLYFCVLYFCLCIDKASLSSERTLISCIVPVTFLGQSFLVKKPTWTKINSTQVTAVRDILIKTSAQQITIFQADHRKVLLHHLHQRLCGLYIPSRL